MDTVRGSRSSTKESGEDGRVKGRKTEGRSVEEMNRKDDRSEGYHAQGFHRWVPEHETGRKRKKNMPDQRPTQTTAAIHITIHREQRITLSHIHTCAHTYTNLCIPLLTQSLHLLISIHTIATHSAVPCLSLRVMTQSLTQTHTTTRTIIKQTSTQSLSIAYLCTTSLVKSN